jgi:hypothetical protein
MKSILLVLAITALLVLTLGVRAGTEADPISVDIVISPSTVFLDSNGTWVTVHAEIPYSQVAGVGVTLDGVAVVFTKADNRGEFVAKFNLDDVKERLTPGTVTLVLSGWTRDGVPFIGSDEIVVKAGGKQK